MIAVAFVGNTMALCLVAPTPLPGRRTLFALGVGVLTVLIAWQIEPDATFVLAWGTVGGFSTMVVAEIVSMLVLRHRAVKNVEAIGDVGRLRRQLVAERHEEIIRILHDTVINTLGAVASGSPVAQDEGMLRAQCVADIEEVNVLFGSWVDRPRCALDGTALQVVVGPAAYINRTGISERELWSQGIRFSTGPIRAVAFATRELVQNAARHSGAEQIDVHVDFDGRHLDLMVRDYGHGFDIGTTPLRGIQRSVIERMAEIGGHVTFNARPGRGTTATLHARVCQINGGSGLAHFS